jgi:ubiquinone/menaquinone biosynthesis C-methylase UbiE
MSDNHLDLWNSDAEAQLLESRLAGYWNLDYLNQIILPQLNLKPGDTVLDAGAGTGSLTLLLAQALPEVQFIGIDITPKMVTDAEGMAEKMGIKNVKFLVADALQLPFENSFFDAAVCQTLLIHLGNARQAVQEMSRVLKPGGIFLAAEYHTLNVEWPIENGVAEQIEDRAIDNAKYAQMIIKGYRQLGHGNLKAGDIVPFLAVQAGLKIVDIRINDRVSFAFPPYGKPSEKAALAEFTNWKAVFQDPSYQSFISGALVAGGGTEADVADFFNILNDQQKVFARSNDDTFAFLWLINPILLIIIARKQ